GRRWPAHARARGPVAEATRGPRPQGNRFRFPGRYRIVAKILFKFGSRSELRLYAVFESYAYMPFSSPTPICRFRVLRLYGLDSADTPMLQWGKPLGRKALMSSITVKLHDCMTDHAV